MNPLEDTKLIVSQFQLDNADKYKYTLNESLKLQKACEIVQLSWSGSYVGWHGKMYFRNFEIPSLDEKFSGEWGGLNEIPEGWEEKQNDEIKSKIETIIGLLFTIKGYEDDIAILRKKAEWLKNEVLIRFSAFVFSSDLKKEQSILGLIEVFKFGTSKEMFMRNKLPGNLMSRDLEALRQGTCMPSWLYYKCVALEGASLCESVEELLILVDKMLRQIELKINTGFKSAPIRENKPDGGSSKVKHFGFVFYTALLAFLICVGIFLIEIFVFKTSLSFSDFIKVLLFLGGVVLSYIKS